MSQRRATEGGAAPGARDHAPPLPPRVLRKVGLVYVSDTAPGLSRRRAGKRFSYFFPGGRQVRDAATIDRVHALAIPPAYTDVWICRLPNGHLQATGRDARGRKQYRYHERWRATRDTAKYDKLAAFADRLPTLRRQVRADLRLEGLPRRKVIAAVVRLLERAFIRVGNEEYSRENGSFGLTTLRNRHVRVRGAQIVFDFRGKSGKTHAIAIEDARLARIIRRCQELPGQHLFEFRNEAGAIDHVDSDDVNAYIKEVMGEEFSAKDFRTWAGTVLAAQALAVIDTVAGDIERKSRVNRAIAEVARRLGNTPSVCRKCYVHPVVLDAYLAERLALPAQARRWTIGLGAQERAVRRLLTPRRARAAP